MTHICVSKLNIIVSDNGLSPDRRQTIIWTNAGLLLTGPLGTNFSEILIGIQTFSFKKMHLKMSSAKGRLFSLGLNELNQIMIHLTGGDVWYKTEKWNGLCLIMPYQNQCRDTLYRTSARTSCWMWNYWDKFWENLKLEINMLYNHRKLKILSVKGRSMSCQANGWRIVHNKVKIGNMGQWR